MTKSAASYLGEPPMPSVTVRVGCYLRIRIMAQENEEAAQRWNCPNFTNCVISKQYTQPDAGTFWSMRVLKRRGTDVSFGMHDSADKVFWEGHSGRQ